MRALTRSTFVGCQIPLRIRSKKQMIWTYPFQERLMGAVWSGRYLCDASKAYIDVSGAQKFAKEPSVQSFAPFQLFKYYIPLTLPIQYTS